DLHYGLLADNLNYQGSTIVQFVRTLHSQIAGPITILWDRIPIHGGEVVEEYFAEHSDVVARPFRPHAPELDPADGRWRYVKHARLPNYGASKLGLLRDTVTSGLNLLRHRPALLLPFVRFTKLPISL